MLSKASLETPGPSMTPTSDERLPIPNLWIGALTTVTFTVKYLPEDPEPSFTVAFAYISETHLAPQYPSSARQQDQYSATTRPPPEDDERSPATPICMLYNNSKGNRCTYHPCRYRHYCYGRHPYSVCPNNHKRPQHLTGHGGSKKRNKSERDYSTKV